MRKCKHCGNEIGKHHHVDCPKNLIFKRPPTDEEKKKQKINNRIVVLDDKIRECLTNACEVSIEEVYEYNALVSYKGEQK